MSFDFSTLITDRSEMDIRSLQALLRKPLSKWTEEELKAYNGGAMKGGYWWTDLNRVSACMEYLDAELRKIGYESGYVPIKIDRPDVPGPGRLPDGYKELEYIEGTGTQYINTNQIMTADTDVLIDFQFLQSSGVYMGVFGVRDTASGNGNLVFSQNQVFSFMLGSSYTQIYTDTSKFLQRHTIHKTGSSALFDGVQTQLPAVSFAGSLPALIFCFSSAGNPESISPMRLYSMQVSKGGVLLRDFVPCADPSGQVGLYDIVSAQFYGNEGTGNFTAGPEKEPEMIPNPKDPYRWYKEDTPTSAHLTQYLTNVEATRSSLSDIPGCPATPSVSQKTSTKWANDIETILLYIDAIIQNMIKTVDLGWALGTAHIGLYGGI